MMGSEVTELPDDFSKFEEFEMEIDSCYTASQIKEAANRLGIAEQHILAPKNKLAIVALLEDGE